MRAETAHTLYGFAQCHRKVFFNFWQSESPFMVTAVMLIYEL